MTLIIISSRWIREEEGTQLVREVKIWIEMFVGVEFWFLYDYGNL